MAIWPSSTTTRCLPHVGPRCSSQVPENSPPVSRDPEPYWFIRFRRYRIYGPSRNSYTLNPRPKALHPQPDTNNTFDTVAVQGLGFRVQGAVFTAAR